MIVGPHGMGTHAPSWHEGAKAQSEEAARTQAAHRTWEAWRAMAAVYYGMTQQVMSLSPEAREAAETLGYL